MLRSISKSAAGVMAVGRKSAGATIACRKFSAVAVDNPYTGETYCEIQRSTEAEALAAVARAASAQKAWAAVSLDERIALCGRFMESLEAMRDQVAKDISGQMGRPYAHAYGEVGGVQERTTGMMALAPEALADEVLEVRNGCQRTITKEPVGVVFVVAPWNYPLLTAVNCIVPAILAGNSVVIRHSERTPLCSEHFQTAFENAGAPPGLVTSVHCAHEVTHSLIAAPEVGFVAFTGSVNGGRDIYKSVASSRFIDTTLELGGNDPAYVAADADAKSAAEGLVDGAMFNAGQSCCGIERVYVHRSKYDEFLAAATELMEGYTLGDPMSESTTMGPLAQANSLDFLSAQVQDAQAKGATVLTGGGPVNDAAGKGRFFAPTLLAGCTHEMDVMMEESFGPILPVAVVDSDEEAVELMSDSPYGLTAAVFTQDQERAVSMGKQIPTGTFFMNRCDYLDPELPWTAGGELTGKGVSLSKHGFGGVTKLKGFNMRA